MIVKIKSCHIKMGTKRNLVTCPVALALSECGFGNVVVSGLYARWSGSGLGSVRLPFSVVDFIQAFDRGAPVQPLDFDLDWKRPHGWEARDD